MLNSVFFGFTVKKRLLDSVFFHGFMSKKELKVYSIVSFSWFYEHEKELKVSSFGENEWLNGMHLCSKHMELTYAN
jgi:hypothetical protein